MLSSLRVTRPVQGVEGTALFEALREGRPAPGPRVAIIGWMHGNEPVGARALDVLEGTLAEELVGGSVLAVRANLEAARLNLRHTPGGRDLNRLWDQDTLEGLAARPTDALCYEERRALELAPLLLSCDAVIDLHSTSRPSTPFLLFRDDQRHAAIARRLGVANLVTGMHENAVVEGGLGCNVGLVAGERSERLGFTFEAGQHTAEGNTERAVEVVIRILHALGVWRTAPPPPGPPGEVYEVLDRFVQAEEGAEPWRFVGYEGGPVGSGRRGPLRRLHSFEEVQADEIIAQQGPDRVVRAQTPFIMLMPAPDTAPGTDLYFVAQPRHGGLSSGETRTADEARREAVAIERMLDLVDDDDFVRGVTWLSFDARQVLDRCAEVVGRTLRLPPDHPHRRITILGRGDLGEEEEELRAGQRYREVMRRAVAEGVPITRIQLLRGALLAWLDVLTSRGMRELIRRREAAHPDAEGIRLLLSVQQPHTVSLLVAGDLDLALQTGDARHVRVGVLIEAASVEPVTGPAAREGRGRPRVRVARLGLISSRVEILTAAQKLLRSLAREHRDLLAHGALQLDEPARSLVLETGELEARDDPQAMAGLRRALVRLQLGQWCEALRHEGLEDQVLEDGEMVSRWMASLMTSAGILDGAALEELVLERIPGAWRVRGDRVAALADALSEGEDGALPRRRARPRPLPPVPMLARDVDADDLQRWFGWKRWVRLGQTIPGTRGKDVDLALVDTEVRARFVRWYRQARERAANAPGDVLVVIAGDGSNPRRDDWELTRAHRALVLDPNVHYVRIQHAAGTHLAWMRDLVEALRDRPAGPGSVSIQWETEHGATVSVVLLAVRRPGMQAEVGSLEGWSVERCAVVLSDLEHSSGRDYKVALLTEPLGDEGPNAELVHFGRQHCQNLLQQARWRVQGPAPVDCEAIEGAVVAQLARWIERARDGGASASMPDEPLERRRGLARRLGIADERLASALVDQMGGEGPVEDVARALWEGVAPWPGRLWQSAYELD